MTAPLFNLVCDRGKKILTENEALRILKSIYQPHVLDFFVNDLKSGNKIRVKEGHLEIKTEKGKTPKGRKRKIVVVEDDDIVRRSVTKMLDKAGYEVTGFADGAPVLGIESFGGFSLILSDVDMPTGGVELLETLRNRGIEIPAILMSGDIRKSENQIRSIVGAQATLQKPFSMVELIETIETLLP